jgi:hypothetical protein
LHASSSVFNFAFAASNRTVSFAGSALFVVFARSNKEAMATLAAAAMYMPLGHS